MKEFILNTTWIIIWSICFFSSFFTCIILKKKSEMIMSESKFRTHKKMISTTLIVTAFYYFIIYGLFEWQFRWPYLSFIFIISAIIILDRYLIAVKYDRKNPIQKLWGINLYWISISYTAVRGLSIISFISMNIIGLRGFAGLYLSAIIVFGLPEMYISHLKKCITRYDPSLHITSPYRNHLHSDEWAFNKSVKPINSNKDHGIYFNALIFESKGSNTSVYSKKAFIFKKYSFSTTVTTYGDLYYSTNCDTLHIGENNHYTPQNYITKKEGKYIHTITKQKSIIPNLSYEEKQLLTLKSAPDNYETFHRIVE